MFHPVLVGIYAVFIGVILVVNKIQDYRLNKNAPMPQEQERLRRLADEESLADYRVRFRILPPGVWSAVVGTASIVRNEVWEFLPDGTGVCSEYGAFGMDKGVTLFEWKSAGDFTLLYRETKSAWEDYPGQYAEEGEEITPTLWQTIRYDFCIAEIDCGTQIAMVSVLDGVLQERFCDSNFALGYSGPVELAEDEKGLP